MDTLPWLLFSVGTTWMFRVWYSSSMVGCWTHFHNTPAATDSLRRAYQTSHEQHPKQTRTRDIFSLKLVCISWFFSAIPSDDNPLLSSSVSKSRCCSINNKNITGRISAQVRSLTLNTLQHVHWTIGGHLLTDYVRRDDLELSFSISDEIIACENQILGIRGRTCRRRYQRRWLRRRRQQSGRGQSKSTRSYESIQSSGPIRVLVELPPLYLVPRPAFFASCPTD